MFKRLISIIVMMLLLLGSNLPVYSAENIMVVVDGTQLDFDVPPSTENGRVLVPLRAIFDALGVEMVWNSYDRSITAQKGSTTIFLKVDYQYAKINGVSTKLDVPARIISGRTLVPVRFISQALGADVQWNASTKTVTITGSLDLSEAQAYLPFPNKKYTYSMHYADGDQGTTSLVVGRIDNFSRISTVELIPQSEAFTTHFVQGPDGINSFSDEEFQKNSYLWLKDSPEVGDSWENNGTSYNIFNENVTCDLGFTTVKNCLAVERNYKEAGYSELVYISPGYGEVLIKDADTGNELLKLTAVTDITESEANQTVKRYSPNVMGYLSK